MTALPFDWGGDSVMDDQIVGYACTAGNASCRAFMFANGVASSLLRLRGLDRL